MQKPGSSSSILHVSSPYSRTRNLCISQHVSNTPTLNSITKEISQNPTSDFTIIEIIKPDRQKYDSNDFIPAFAKPCVIQDSSMELATMMNLEPLKTSFLQEEKTSQFFSFSPQMFSGSHQGNNADNHATNIDFNSNVDNHNDIDYNNNTTNNDAAKKSSSRTQSSQYVCRSTITNPIQGHQPYPLTMKEVVDWVNQLHQYIFLSEAYADELYKLLCTIQAEMAHPFLTPRVLAETKLGMVLKTFRHGVYETRSKRLANKIVHYWRKVCLEA